MHPMKSKIHVNDLLLIQSSKVLANYFFSPYHLVQWQTIKRQKMRVKTCQHKLVTVFEIKQLVTNGNFSNFILPFSAMRTIVDFIFLQSLNQDNPNAVFPPQTDSFFFNV